MNLLAAYDKLLLDRAREGVTGVLRVEVSPREYEDLEYELHALGRGLSARFQPEVIEIRNGAGRIVIRPRIEKCE